MKFTYGRGYGFEVWRSDSRPVDKNPDCDLAPAGWYYWCGDHAPTGPFATLREVVTAAETATKLYCDAIAAEF